MILKAFELSKIEKIGKNFFLLYGENEGLKNEIIRNNFEKKYINKIYRYDEYQVLNNKENFFNNIYSKSFFEDKKLILISRASDKIKDIMEELIEKKIEDTKIVINCSQLEKKSKLRNLFEKNSDTVCIPFYADTNQTLTSIINKYFKEKKIPISQQAINLLSDRCRGDRQNLNNELNKIDNFIINKKKINLDDILKLTNLAENYNVSELIDNCLAKNKSKTVNILNENIYNVEDCIIIIRTFLIKAKRLLTIVNLAKKNNNLEVVISSIKPPVFWKDKEIVKRQANNWSSANTENLIYRINQIELLIKKNSNSSINILSDFIIEQSTITSN